MSEYKAYVKSDYARRFSHYDATLLVGYASIFEEKNNLFGMSGQINTGMLYDDMPITVSVSDGTVNQVGLRDPDNAFSVALKVETLSNP